MTDPASALLSIGADTALGKALTFVQGIIRRLSFRRRAARHAYDELKEYGRPYSRRQLRKLLRAADVKRAMTSRRPDAIASAIVVISAAHRDRTTESSISPNKVFKILERGYFAASEQVHRDLVVRDEMNERFDQLTVTGSARDALWEANIDRFYPPFADDARALRQRHGDTIDRLIHELEHSPDRAATLRSWSKTPPPWLSSEGDIAGWIGELAANLDRPESALPWFDRAVTAGAVPAEYWRARQMQLSNAASDQSNVESLDDLADDPLIAALIRGSFEERLSNIRAWQPQTATQRSYQASVVTQFLLNLLESDEAISYGTTAFNEYSYSGAGMNAVEALIQRSARRPETHAEDTAAAYTLAVRIRDARRTWGLSSGSAVAKAIKAAMMLSDIDRARMLSSAPEATDDEIRHPEVRNEMATVMMLGGDIQASRQFIDDQTPRTLQLQIDSREAELLDQQDEANRLLAEAIDATNDWNERAPLCFRLALRGVVHPFVEDLRIDNPEIVQEIELVADLNSGRPGAEAKARAKSTERPTLALSLIARFEAAGRWTEVIFTAEQAAQQWSDPDFWLKAARAYLAQGDHPNAVDRASKALQVGGQAWGNRADAHIVQIEAASAVGDWPTALVNARALIQIRPESDTARWALVQIHRMSGDVDQAWSEWKAGNQRPRPRNQTEANIWFELFRLHGPDMATLSEFFDVVDQFSQVAETRNLALGALAFAPQGETEESLNLSTLLDRFEKEYPEEQHAIWRIQTDAEEPEDILKQLDAAIGPRQELLGTLDEHVRSGTLPIGLAAQLGGKHVAELLTRRHKSPRFAGSMDGDERQDEAVGAALQLGAAVDVTALFTLTLLSTDESNMIVAALPRMVATPAQMLDASANRERYSTRFDAEFIQSTTTTEASVLLKDPIELNVQRNVAGRLVEWFRRVERRSARPSSPKIAEQLDLDDHTWASAIDLAKDADLPLWCDDAATRRLADDQGVRSFGTPALIEFLRRTRHISEASADNLDAQLIHNWTVGIEYRAIVFDLVARIDQHAPLGLTAAIEFGGPRHAREKVDFAVKAMGIVASMPDQLGGWTSTAFRYLAGIADAQATIENHVVLVREVLLQPWMTASYLRFIAAAGRSVAADHWLDAFERGFAEMYSRVSQHSDRSSAAGWALGLTAELEPAERQAALRAVLSS
ncbi:tetratricopeptide repeat protein [Agromyces sp. NPDC056965]|uniref:tetratricopeptide repeat protein n=1 Tax=Agromyces sp. NPDC056965 TaxID=3345983 RepID=UPI0036372A48